MAIDVEWQDENGETLSRYDGPIIDGLLPEHAPAGSCCLRFIDPYGDTTFNGLQVAVLEEELASLVNDGQFAERARSLLAFIRLFPDRTHRYLKFIGD